MFSSPQVFDDNNWEILVARMPELQTFSLPHRGLCSLRSSPLSEVHWEFFHIKFFSRRLQKLAENFPQRIFLEQRKRRKFVSSFPVAQTCAWNDDKSWLWQAAVGACDVKPFELWKLVVEQVKKKVSPSQNRNLLRGMSQMRLVQWWSDSSQISLADLVFLREASRKIFAYRRPRSSDNFYAHREKAHIKRERNRQHKASERAKERKKATRANHEKPKLASRNVNENVVIVVGHKAKKEEEKSPKKETAGRCQKISSQKIKVARQSNRFLLSAGPNVVETFGGTKTKWLRRWHGKRGDKGAREEEINRSRRDKGKKSSEPKSSWMITGTLMSSANWIPRPKLFNEGEFNGCRRGVGTEPRRWMNPRSRARRKNFSRARHAN
jgi:hypothetical protein